MSMKKLYKMIAVLMSGRTLIFVSIAFIGAIQIFFQLIMPDLVPDAVNNLWIQNNSQFTGYVLGLFLVLWIYSGIILFIGGTVTAIISHVLDYKVFHRSFFLRPIYNSDLKTNSEK